MFYPKLYKPSEKSYTVDSFAGLTTGELVPDGFFSSMENLTGDSFPLMKVREKRGIYKSAYPLSFEDEKITAACNTANGILICTETKVFVGAVEITQAVLDSSVKIRTAVPFGRNVFIAPDGIYIKFSDTGISVSNCNFTYESDSAYVTYSMADGTDIFPLYFGDIPEAANAGDTLVISSETGMELYQYTGDTWIKKSDLYFRIAFPENISGFSEGTEIYASSSEKSFSDGLHKVVFVTDNSLVLSGPLKVDGDVTGVRLSKNIPCMDFAVEHNNRLWACRYGKNNDGAYVNEIYASKLGNPEEWYSFDGISTDSYAVSLGCHGEFTGAGKLGNEVLFFKEDFIIRVLGDTPSDFTVYTVPARGVEKGQNLSIVNLNERIFYKSNSSVMVYDGSLPVSVSEALDTTGFSDSVAGGYKGKYRIAMTDSEGIRGIYAYDISSGLWHREDDRLNTRFMFIKDGTLFHLGLDTVNISYTLFTDSMKNITDKNKAIPVIGEVAFTPYEEAEVLWYAETGKLSEDITSLNKKIRSLRFSLSLGEDALIKVSVKTDCEPEYKRIFYLDKKTDGIFRALVPTAPCQSFTLKLQGRNECSLYAIERVVQLCGEVKNID